jgi:hypothetical protein
MKSHTIEDLMMFLCTSRFDIEEQEARLLEKFFSHDELEAVKEEKDDNLDDIEIEPISDTEEQETSIDKETELDKALLTAFEGPTAREPQVPLPVNNTQVRASGRKRKKCDNDMFEYY